jgi:hypothetical protein
MTPQIIQITRGISKRHPKYLHWKELNPLNAQLNPTCHLMALLGAYHILRVSRVRIKKDISH